MQPQWQKETFDPENHLFPFTQLPDCIYHNALNLTNPAGAVIAINPSNYMFKKVSMVFPSTGQQGAFHVWTLPKHFHPSKSHGWGRHIHQKGIFVWILCCCGRKLPNESQWLAITAAVVTRQNLPSMSRSKASCCSCSGTPSPGAVLRCAKRRLLIPQETASLLKPACQPSGKKDSGGVHANYLKI